MKEKSNQTAEYLTALENEEAVIRKTVIGDSKDFDELQSEWQERDSPAERNLREVEWNQYSALQHELSEIEAAKKRLENGKYGMCEDCAGPIPEKRLKLLPAVRRCIACQAENEKRDGIPMNVPTL